VVSVELGWQIRTLVHTCKAAVAADPWTSQPISPNEETRKCAKLADQSTPKDERELAKVYHNGRYQNQVLNTNGE